MFTLTVLCGVVFVCFMIEFLRLKIVLYREGALRWMEVISRAGMIVSMR